MIKFQGEQIYLKMENVPQLCTVMYIVTLKKGHIFNIIYKCFMWKIIQAKV